MEDFSQDPNFKIYSQDSKVFPETLAQLAHVHYQKKLFLNNQNEFLFEGKAGIDGMGVLDTPSNFHWKFIFIFIHSSLSYFCILR